MSYQPHASADLSANFTIAHDTADLSANFTLNHQKYDLSANFTVHNILSYFQHAVESTTGANFLTPQSIDNYVIRQANRDKIATIDVKYSNVGDRFSWVTPASILQVFAGTNVNNKTKIFGGHVKEPERVGEEIIFHGQGYGEELLRRKVTDAFYDVEATDLIKNTLLNGLDIDNSQLSFIGEETTRTGFHSDAYADESNIESKSNVSLSSGDWTLDADNGGYLTSGYIISNDFTTVSEASTSTQEYFDDAKIDITKTTPSGTSLAIYVANTGSEKPCLDFDGTDDQISFGDILDFERTDAFSLELWFNAGESSDNGGLICKMANGTAAMKGYGLWWESSLNRLAFRLISDVGSGNRAGIYALVISGNSIKDNDWHHIVATYDGSSSASGMKLYLNGSLLSTTYYNDNLSASISTSNNFTVGSRHDDYYVPGFINKVRVYNQELTAANVLSNYNKAYSPISSGLVLRADIDEGTGSTAYDTSGNGTNGTISGATWQYLYKPFTDNTWTTFIDAHSAPTVHGRELKYKILFTSDGVDTPTLSQIDIDVKTKAITVYETLDYDNEPLFDAIKDVLYDATLEGYVDVEGIYQLDYVKSKTTTDFMPYLRQGYEILKQPVWKKDSHNLINKLKIVGSEEGALSATEKDIELTEKKASSWTGTNCTIIDEYKTAHVKEGDYCIKGSISSTAADALSPTFSAAKNLDDYENLYCWYEQNAADAFSIRLETDASNYFSWSLTPKDTNASFEIKLLVGSKSSGWISTGRPSWTNITQIRFVYGSGVSTTTFYIDKLFFTVKPVTYTHNDTDSQTEYGIYEGKTRIYRNLSTVDLCEARAKAIINLHKNLHEPLDLVVYGRKDIKTGDLVKVYFPKSGITDIVFRVDAVEFLLGTMTLTRLFCSDINTVTLVQRLKQIDYETKQIGS